MHERSGTDPVGPVLAVAGDLIADVVVWDAPSILARGTDNPARLFHTRGGSAANVAVAAAEFVPVRFFGRVGDDLLGAALIDTLRERGIDARVQRGGRTGTIVALIDDEGERTMLTDRGASGEIEPLPDDALDEVSWLHLPLYGFQTHPSAASLRELALRAGEAGIPVSVDLSSVALLRDLDDGVFPLLSELRPKVVLANADEAAELALRDIPVGDVGTARVIKNGPDPVEVITPDGTLTITVPPVETVRDSTGAGDGFAAGLLSSLLRGESLEEAVRAGIRASAEVLSRPGA